MATPEEQATLASLAPDDPLRIMHEEEQAQLAAAQEAPPAEGEPPAEEPRLYAGKYKTIEEMEQGVLEARRLIGEHGNERARLQAELDQVRQQQAGAEAPYTMPQGRDFLPDGTPILTAQELDNLRDEDPYAAARLEGKYESFQMRYEMEQSQAQMMAPLVAMTNDMVARTALETLRERVGDDLLNAHKTALAEALTSDPTHFEDVKTRVQRMEWVVRAAAQQASDGASTQARTPTGQFAAGNVHTEGGSGAAPAGRGAQQETLEEREERELREYKPQTDAFGERPYGVGQKAT